MFYTAIAYNYPNNKTVQLIVLDDYIEQSARLKLKNWMNVEQPKQAIILNIATNLPVVALSTVIESTVEPEKSILDSILENDDTVTV